MTVLLTEEEARKKWCPMVHSRMLVAVERERVHSQKTVIELERLRSQNCIAADCMMWRWSFGGNFGFCGIAGQPREAP